VSITLDYLIERVRLGTDHVSSSFITDNEVTQYLNVEGAELHNIIVSRYEDYLLTSSNFTLNNNESYTPSESVQKLMGLDMYVSGRPVPLDQFSFRERFRASQQSIWDYGTVNVLTYHWAGANVLVYPETQCAGTYKLWYVPSWTDLASGSNPTLRAPYTLNHWEEIIINGACAKVCMMEVQDPTPFLAAKNADVNRIKNDSTNRDASGNRRVRDVTGGDDWFWPMGRWPRR